MPNMTLSIPKELHDKMKKHSEIRWSQIARRSILEKIDDLEILEKITKKSKLTQKDVNIISSRINKEVFKELNKR